MKQQLQVPYLRPDFKKISYKNYDICETIGSLNTKRILDNIEDVFLFSGLIMVA